MVCLLNGHCHLYFFSFKHGIEYSDMKNDSGEIYYECVHIQGVDCSFGGATAIYNFQILFIFCFSVLCCLFVDG